MCDLHCLETVYSNNHTPEDTYVLSCIAFLNSKVTDLN